MSDAAAADRYARAIFEIGQETGQMQALGEQMQRFAEHYEANADLRVVLSNPRIDEAQRESLIQALGARLGLAKTATDAVKLLSRKRRLSILDAVAKRLSELADDKSKVLRVLVRSARPLSSEYCERLSREIQSATGRSVMLEKSVDPSLIAGIVTQIGDNTIDGTVLGRLQSYEQRLLSNI
ncbi:MAG TPA: ATP synthase F1 subunit delta [Polyangiaceae bacterium]|jgi:F-type H+-transporting ATPase subunit delta|nr:ATP synthase F1 subunit delta [Polyangiaceae bacterium]